MSDSESALDSNARFIAWRPAVLAGLIGGLAYLAMQFLWSSLATGAGSWTWFRFTGAIVLGRGVLTQETFDLTVFVVTLLVHFGLSIAYAIVLGLLVARGGTGLAVLIGALFGAAVYAVNYYAFTAVFPWFVELRHNVTLVNNVVFGVATAAAYRRLGRTSSRTRG
ncbi:MAG TPA: hypothetical protein VNK91_12645 [Burkholderiaceae bacterium]|jgi:hypothetical protein|nr:hypothetical protein [Burkholderiaceae bacterium]